jgi:NAD(P)-dependent dehydrogenase (short-subunit alcohol dehydrogenase family)
MIGGGDASKVALVTGASYGVGAECALTLGRAGFRLAITATCSSNLLAVMDKLNSNGIEALSLDLDLRSHENIEQAVAAVLAHFGRIDVLVNNAAVNLRRKAIDVTRSEWDDIIATNLTGTFFLTQQVGRHLIGRGVPGQVVTIASTHAFVGADARSVYGISKAGLVQMTRMLAIEWAQHGITVNAVAPGRMITESPSRAITASDSAYMETMLKRIPLHRLATVEEVAAAVAFLVSPAARSITGQTIILDGGLNAS